MFVRQSDIKSNDRRYFKNIWRHTDESSESSQSFGFVSDCGDRHSLFNQKFTEMQSGKDNQRKRYKFTITDAEVAYWRRIHDLNQAEKSAAPIEKPAPVRQYVIQTFELITAEGGRP